MLTFREVGADDYDAVMAILPKAWDGRDYLPDKYLEYVADPDCRCFACEIDGEMVGFHAVLLVDAGERMVRIGGRVKATHQGQGIYHALQRHIYKSYESYRRLQWDSIVMVKSHTQKLKESYVDEHGFSEVAIKKRYLYAFDVSSIKTENNDVPATVKEVSETDMMNILTSEALSQSLFPDGRIYLHCKPYLAIPANHRHFIRNTYILATAEAERHLQTGNSSSDEIPETTIEDLVLFTIGNSYQQSTGLHYNIELYGDNMATFPAHLSRHLKHVRSISDRGCVHLVVHAYDNVDVTLIDEAMQRYHWEKDVDYDESIHLFERPFSVAVSEAYFTSGIHND